MFTKIWKGLNELKDLDLLESVNTIMDLAQPEGCSPIVEAFEQNETQVRPIKPDTIAKSLAIGNPASGPYSLQTLYRTSGVAVASLEEKITQGISKVRAQPERRPVLLRGAGAISCTTE